MRERALPPHTLEGLNKYLDARVAAASRPVTAPTGPLFTTTGDDGEDGSPNPTCSSGSARWPRSQVSRPARQEVPHSFRHALATGSRQAGIPLEDVQDAMGHDDPRAARHYDRDRHNLDRDPAYEFAKRRASRRRPAGLTSADATSTASTGTYTEVSSAAGRWLGWLARVGPLGCPAPRRIVGEASPRS